MAPLAALGIGGAAALSRRRSLPELSPNKVNAVDRPHWKEARSAGAKCLAAIYASAGGVSEHVADQVA